MSKILVVEDETAINRMLCMNLDIVGYETAAFFDGRQLLDYLADGGRADLALVDVMLPKVGGFELLEPLKNLMLNGDSNGYTMTDVYRESLVWSSDAEEHLRRELDRIFEKSSGTFADAEDEMRDELQRFSFLMMLSHEVQIRKSLMQKILDAYRKPESQKEMKPAKHKKKKA